MLLREMRRLENQKLAACWENENIHIASVTTAL